MSVFSLLCAVRIGINKKSDCSFIWDLIVVCPNVCGELGGSICLSPNVCLILCDAETQKWGGVYMRWVAERQDKANKFVSFCKIFSHFTLYVM